MVEPLAHNQICVGSSPARPIGWRPTAVRYMKAELTFNLDDPQEREQFEQVVSAIDEVDVGIDGESTPTEEFINGLEAGESFAGVLDMESEELSAAVAETTEEAVIEAEEEEISEVSLSEELGYEMKDKVEVDGEFVYLRWGDGLSNAGKVVQFLMNNPRSTTREIADEMGWDTSYTNTIMTSNPRVRELFVGWEPVRDNVQGNAYEWAPRISLVTE